VLGRPVAALDREHVPGDPDRLGEEHREEAHPGVQVERSLAGAGLEPVEH